LTAAVAVLRRRCLFRKERLAAAAAAAAQELPPPLSVEKRLLDVDHHRPSDCGRLVEVTIATGTAISNGEEG